MRQRRLDIVSRNHPYLVAECAGEVVGYAYASLYRPAGGLSPYRRKLGRYRRRVRPRARRSPPRPWWARPKSAPGSSSFDYCARSTRSPRRGSLPRCIRLAPPSLSRSVLPESSRSRCCMRRQRHDHDREGQFAIGIVRPKGVRAAQRFAVGTRPDAASGVTVPVWFAARSGRDRRGRTIGGAVPRRLRLVVPAAPTPCRRDVPPRRSAAQGELLDDAIVQVGSSPPTVGR
jgi:hypothetical protein